MHLTHLTHLQAITLVQDLAGRLAPRYDEVEVSIHPAFTSLRAVQVFLEGDDIPLVLGAQNVSFEPESAFTGEVSTSMLAALDVCYVIVGHSECRRLFGETDEIVNEKIHAVHEAKMTPICCVGDSLEDHERGATDDVVVGQVTAALQEVAADAVAGMVIAYEPLWAIVTGRSAAPGDAEAVCAAIRGAVASLFDERAAQALRIQYGGSVEPENAKAFFAEPDIDGALVGGASLDAERFAPIVALGRR
jgi:triosephosphate isomerase